MLFWLNHIFLPPHPLQFLIPSNLLIEFLLHLVDKIGTAGILAQFDGCKYQIKNAPHTN